MTDKPIAWGMPQPDGTIIDCITPEEHARMPGQYTVPLCKCQPKAEPDVPETEFGDMVEPQAQGSVAWAQVPPAFTDWWDSEYSDLTNPFRLNSAAYWAWAGWCAALAEPQEGSSLDELRDMLRVEVDRLIAATDAPQPRKRLDVHEVLDLLPEGIPAKYDAELIAFCRAIEAKLFGETQ